MNKTVLISGGTRGIGLGIARVMLRQGWKVAINGTREESCARAAEALAPLAAPGALVTAAFRVEAADAWDGALDRIEAAIGPVDAFVANAGIITGRDGLSTPLVDADQGDWDATFAVNLTGVVNGFRAVARRIIARKGDGAFVAVSSLAGRIGLAGAQAAYTVSKAAVIGLGRQQAMELGPKGIRVNVVTPGMIDTDMLRSVGIADRPEFVAGVALGRIGKPEEVGETVEFLLSPRASYITGVTIDVAGGLHVS